MSTAEPIAKNTLERVEIDPFLAAMEDIMARDEIELDFLAVDNITVIAPEDTQDTIDKAVDRAIAEHAGLSLLIIAGGGTNPDPEAAGPRCLVEVEMQLYLKPALRPPGSPGALELVGRLIRFWHDKRINVTGFPWFEEIRWRSFDALPDPDFTAYSIVFERDLVF